MAEPELVTGSPLTRNGVDYAWRQLAERSGLAPEETRVVSFAYRGIAAGRAVRPAAASPPTPRVTVVPCRPTAFQSVLEHDSPPLLWLTADAVVPAGAGLPISNSVPILFWGEGFEDGGRPFAERLTDGSVVFYADIVAAAFFMLSRWEETVVATRDEHGRFPDTASVAYRLGFIDRPIVDEYALILREWVRLLLPRWKPSTGRFEVKLSHDIDWLRRTWNLPVLVRSLGADLLRTRRPRRAVKTFKTLTEATAEIAIPQSAPRFRAIYELAKMSLRYGLDSVFYLMAAPPGRFDDGYDLNSRYCRRCIARLRRQGFEVGLHASYDSFDSPSMLAAEKGRMEKVLDGKVYGSRQHRLRFKVPQTWRHLEQIGLQHDSTMSYAEYEGFRCGTCHPFRPFDGEQDRELSIREVPLVVKDNTLRVCRRLAPAQAEARILELAQRCKCVEGVFTLLWHNTLLDSDRRDWVATYEQVLSGLSVLADAGTK